MRPSRRRRRPPPPPPPPPPSSFFFFSSSASRLRPLRRHPSRRASNPQHDVIDHQSVPVLGVVRGVEHDGEHPRRDAPRRNSRSRRQLRPRVARRQLATRERARPTGVVQERARGVRHTASSSHRRVSRSSSHRRVSRSSPHRALPFAVVPAASQNVSRTRAPSGAALAATSLSRSSSTATATSASGTAARTARVAGRSLDSTMTTVYFRSRLAWRRAGDLVGGDALHRDVSSPRALVASPQHQSPPARGVHPRGTNRRGKRPRDIL